MVNVRSYERRVGTRPEYYIMNANSEKKLMFDKDWRAGNSFLIVRTVGSGRRFIISGAGHGYSDDLGKRKYYTFETGMGHRIPPYGDESFIVEDIILFDENGEPNKSFNPKMSFYVMK